MKVELEKREVSTVTTSKNFETAFIKRATLMVSSQDLDLVILHPQFLYPIYPCWTRGDYGLFCWILLYHVGIHLEEYFTFKRSP